ncbi:V-type ATPase subunit [Streptantibioticus rubrisoli]|uniref:V-type ATPase subunit n=1 Tax=Streptantibioticus rubrisoli TaxID=1387313 RepID=A0ABT1PBH4_9ACTN|nr:V-type ATPase subunit [Streptantibioticus rubrisoli]MCQ4042728.1 V-type ATPase subunit [Streptantibioticus rubrisoli]
MGAGWVAGVTRARAMVPRRVGASGARQVAAAGSIGEALRHLMATPYRKYLRAGAVPEEAQRAVTAALLWHLRVLAGWQPREGVAAIRLLAAGFEISNVEDHLRSLSGELTPEPYRLGALATAWPRLARTGGADELRAALTASAWGDPGGSAPAEVATGMRIAAASRSASAVPSAARWAAGRAALLVARELFVGARELTGPTARRASRLLGPTAMAARSFPEFRERLPHTAQWAVRDIADVDGLWRAEAHWWARLEQDGFELLRGSRFDASCVVGAVAVLSTDAWRVRAALEVAARGGQPMEAFDALV